jgi:hypothetical protein
MTSPVEAARAPAAPQLVFGIQSLSVNAVARRSSQAAARATTGLASASMTRSPIRL